MPAVQSVCKRGDFSVVRSSAPTKESFLYMAYTDRDIIKATKVGDIEKARLILDTDPTLINATDQEGTTPLHFACWKGYIELARLFLERGASLSVENEGNMHWGGTPLHAAAHANNRAAAALLIEKGADVNHVSKNGRTPLQETELHSATAVAKLLKEHGARFHVGIPNIGGDSEATE